jgi:diadenosine tetraphosphate (Ap4A) HIT family hydrolase
MHDSCLLCAPDLTKAGELIMDFGDWRLLLHADSSVKGHAMLAAVRHVENFADLSETEAHEFARVQRVVERALLDVTATDRTILMKLGVQTPHFHVHIYPVRKTMSRTEIMRAINGDVAEAREEDFARRVRDRILRLT